MACGRRPAGVWPKPAATAKMIMSVLGTQLWPKLNDTLRKPIRSELADDAVIKLEGHNGEQVSPNRFRGFGENAEKA